MVKKTIAPDFVLAVHFLFVFFVLFGGFFVSQAKWVLFFHVPSVLWSSIVNLAKWTCPLTPLEKNLRQKAGQQAFKGSWIQNYLEPLVRPLGMPRRMELIAGISVLLWNTVVYLIVFLT